jgi:cytochrome c biogenesis protein CcdA
MLAELVAKAGDYIHASPLLALGAVFVGGLLTASNPCVLAMVPLMMSYVAGDRSQGHSLARSFLLSLTFVTGLAVTFTALGMIAALAGRMYGEVSGTWNWIVAVVSLLMGLHLMGVLTVPIPSLGGRLAPKVRGLLGAFLLGLLFGVVSAPCAAPILIVLLTYLAGSGSSVAWGAMLLLTYALGHSVLILAAGTSIGAARALLENKNATHLLGRLRQVAGAAIVLVGVYFAYRGLP